MEYGSEPQYPYASSLIVPPSPVAGMVGGGRSIEHKFAWGSTLMLENGSDIVKSTKRLMDHEQSI